jgi:hypothetical protein
VDGFCVPWLPGKTGDEVISTFVGHARIHDARDEEVSLLINRYVVYVVSDNEY